MCHGTYVSISKSSCVVQNCVFKKGKYLFRKYDLCMQNCVVCNDSYIFILEIILCVHSWFVCVCFKRFDNLYIYIYTPLTPCISQPSSNVCFNLLIEIKGLDILWQSSDCTQRKFLVFTSCSVELREIYLSLHHDIFIYKLTCDFIYTLSIISCTLHTFLHYFHIYLFSYIYIYIYIYIRLDDTVRGYGYTRRLDQTVRRAVVLRPR